jgi:hypothetical protein
MSSAQDDSSEFERLRRRVRMIRKWPAFIGLLNQAPDLPDEHISGRIHQTLVKYQRFRNARVAADDIISLMHENRKVVPIFLAQIEKCAKENRMFLTAELGRRKLHESPVVGPMPISFIDLDWMTAAPDYGSVAILYRRGHERPTDLDAILAKMEQKSAPSIPIRNVGRRGERIPQYPCPRFWDGVLEKIDLTDLIMISSAVPEELMDMVIADQGRVSNFRY